MARDAYEIFNNLVGNRRGRRRTRVKPRMPQGYNRGQVARRVLRGSSSVRPRVTSYARKQANLGGGRRRAPVTASNIQDPWQNVFNELTEKYEQTAREGEAIARTNADALDENRGFWGERLEDIGWYDDAGVITSDEGFGGSIIGRSLDLLSRPAYGLAEGLQTVAEHEDQGWSPGNIIDTITEGIRGVGRGLIGEDKTGFGQVYEALQNNPNSDIGGALRSFEENYPTAEQWASRGLGLAGELFLDPLNAITPSAPRINSAGEVVTEATQREATRLAAREATEEFLANSPVAQGRTPWYSSPDMILNRVQNNADDFYTQAMLNVNGGGSRGLRLMNDRIWPNAVANNVTQSIRDSITAPFRGRVEGLWGKAKKIDMKRDIPRVQHYIMDDPDFAEFWDELGTRLVADKIVTPSPTVREILHALNNGRVPRRVWDDTYNQVIAKFDVELQPYFRQVYEGAQNPFIRTVGIKVGNKQLPFKAVGRAYHKIADRPMNKILPNRTELLDDVFYERGIPGIFGGKAARARAMGFRALDKFDEDLRRIAKQLSRDEGRLMQDWIAAGTKPVEPRLAGLYDEIKDLYRKIFLEEKATGARPIADTYDPNYTFIHNKGGSPAKTKEFKDGRKQSIQRTGSAGAYTTSHAQSLGLKPELDAIQNLRARYIKSRRDMTRAIFYNDLVENYGISAKALQEGAIRRRGLVPVTKNRLSNSLRLSMEAKGERLYLPREIATVAKKFEEMNSWSTSQWNQVGRAYANVINKLKAGLTLPYPGFHFRNFIGDVFMGMLDDIRPRAYLDIFAKWQKYLRGQTSNIVMIKGHLEYDFESSRKLFHDNADAGFIDVDIDPYRSLSAGNVIRRSPSIAAEKLRKVSDMREQFPRFVHFIEAFRQEANLLWKQGMRDIAKIEDLSTNAAVWRVNHFKFDYAALLPWEKKLKTTVFPFYTYMRKAIPTLMEQMYTNPHYFSVINRWMEYNDGSSADNFNQANVPQYLRDMGIGFLTDEDEPLGLTADILPIGALDTLNSMPLPGGIGGGSFQEFSGNILSDMNPLIQAPIEQWAGREIFSGRPTENTAGQYALNNLPLLPDLFGVGPSDPGGWNPNNPAWLNLISERFGLGVPVRRVNAGQQAQQQNANFDELIQGPINEFNYSQDRYHISHTENFTYRLKDLQSNRILATAGPDDLQSLLDFAQSLPASDFQGGNVSPFEAPTPESVETYLAGR